MLVAAVGIADHGHELHFLSKTSQDL
jgi:hypothetical protein